MPFQCAAKELFYRSPKLNDPRLGECVEQYTKASVLDNTAWVLFGYPDDEGVRQNLGRPGANQAPDQIRRYLYRTSQRKSLAPIWDGGNLVIQSQDLLSRHDEVRKHHEFVYPLARVIGLGGGHDWAYPDVAAFLHASIDSSNEKPLVINFDAHLDVRKFEDHPHSGTPFYRLLEEFKGFDLIQVGIQPMANSEYHERYCTENGVSVLFIQDRRNFLSQLTPLLAPLKRPCFLSVDMDVFAASEAPGVSAPAATGLLWSEVEPLLELILRQTHVKGLGLYEVAPPLDLDDRTSRLAASIIYYCMENG